jgi:threonine dehydrogenase-like Zn-dependent dehydrogenase
MRRAIEGMRNGAIDPQPLFTHGFSLEQLGQALDMTEERPDGFVKAVVVP